MNKFKFCSILLILLFSVLAIKEVNAATISVHANRDRVATGEEVTLSGVILPRHKKVKITVLGASTIDGIYEKITTVKTKKRGKYTVDIAPTATQYIKLSYLRGSKKIYSQKKLITLSDELSIIAPYVNEDEISSVNEAYSMSENAPWGFVHPGVDFFITSGTTPVQAVTDGKVINLSVEKEENQMGWHAGFCIEYGAYAPCYNLETFSQDDAIGDLQSANIFIANDQIVEQGDVIANLVFGGDGSHIDFGIGYGGTRVCPEPYFTEEAQESVMYLITKDHPDWPMCYEEE